MLHPVLPTSLRCSLNTAAKTWLLCGLLFGCNVVIERREINAQAPNPDPSMEWTHLQDPRIELKEGVLFWPDQLRKVWMPALQHSESDLRREAADSIAQAHRRGMPQLEELNELLLAVLETPDEHPVTRTAAARALIAIDARQHVEALAKHAAIGPQSLTLAVESALADWDYAPARQVWLARLQSTAANALMQRKAIESLGKVKEPKAMEPLAQLALSPIAQGSIRLAAAEALSQIQSDQLVGWSKQLMAGVSANAALDGLVGVQLLMPFSTPEVIDLLDAYAVRTEATVIAAAMRQLLTKDPQKLVARAATTATHPDGNIRLLTVSALRTAPTTQSLDLLAPLLNDPVPVVRYEARRVILVHAADMVLRDHAIQLTEQLIQTEEWRSLEQSILILTELKQLQVGDRLVALLNHERPEVYVAASWGLKTMADPMQTETIYQQMLTTSTLLSTGELPGRKSEMLTHLIEAVGILRHAEAIPHLKKLIPKSAPYDQVPRTAAIWALGYLSEGQHDAELISALESRLNDANSTPMESESVRGMSAVALGRIGSPDSLSALRNWYVTEGPNTFIGRRSGWAVNLMTGEPLPDVEPLKIRTGGWFVQPVGE